MLEEKNPKISEILTTGQIAKICRVDPRTVTRWIDEGVLKAYELPVTGFKRVRIEDFLTFLRSHKIALPDEFLSLLRPRILVVDDEAGVRSAIRRTLSYPDDTAYELEFAEDGFEAGRKIAAFKPDLVVLDVLMPKLDGFSALRSIRGQAETRHIKVLVISSLIPDSERDRALDHGADDFLSKPFDDEEFRRRVTRLLGGRVPR
jgi:two-component system response regulator VicR